MITHDHVGMDIKTFRFLTEFKTFDNDIPVSLSGKQINPIHYLKRQKVPAFLIPYFIATTQNDAILNVIVYVVRSLKLRTT